MKPIKFSLTLVACAMIAACGSSGGSDNPTSQNSKPTTNSATTTNNSNSPSNNSNSSATNTSSTNSSHTGNAIVIKAGDDNDDNVIISKVKLSDPDFSKINVEGKVIQITYPGISARGWQKMGVGDTELFACCGKYSDMRFGAYEGGENDNAYFFHNGNATKNMPTTGVANYKGEVIIAGQTAHFDDEDYLTGSSQFTADFANKKLSGTLNVDSMKPINVDATISNNDFTGKASSGDFATSAKVDGKFYGDKAKELSGVFDDGKSWSGAFGAAQAK